MLCRYHRIDRCAFKEGHVCDHYNDMENCSMSETMEEQLYRIAFGFHPKHYKHTRKEFTEYIKIYYPYLLTLLTDWWHKRYLAVNGYQELYCTEKLVDYIANERYKRCQ
jgi:hypothetical protein